MSSDQNSSTSSSGHETWNTEWADFALVAGTGEELKCHKTVLAKSSPFFKAMLSSDCEETKTNKMELKHFSLETVSTFLEYLQADFEWVPMQDLYRRMFDKSKITPELMKMCHMYEVRDLYEKCSQHLMENICDTNAVGIWIEAERCENLGLKDLALKYIAKKKENIASIPGMDETYKSPSLMKSVVDFLASRIDDLANDLEKTTKTVDLMTKRNTASTVTISTRRQNTRRSVTVKKSDTVMALKEAFVINRWRDDVKTQLEFALYFGDLELADHRTLAFYNITDGTHIYVEYW